MLAWTPQSTIQTTQHSKCQTLLWIGPRHSRELRGAYAFCEMQCDQIAYRATLSDALNRGAGLVDRIVVSRVTRAVYPWQVATRLAAIYPSASIACLLGELCEGVLHDERFAVAEANRQLESLQVPPWPMVAWHQWQTFFPSWMLTRALNPRSQNANRSGHSKASISVIASTLSAAEPILDAIARHNIAAIWLRYPNPGGLRNLDGVVWDSSAAPPTSAPSWQQRIASMKTSTSCRHLWLASSLAWHQTHSARAGGIASIIRKPNVLAPLDEFLVTLTIGAAPDGSIRRCHPVAA